MRIADFRVWIEDQRADFRLYRQTQIKPPSSLV
jgi:hypothetical protein